MPRTPTRTLDCDVLRRNLALEEETGVFRWRTSTRGRRAGDIAGSNRKDGYITIALDGVSYLAHRLVWAYVHGEFPLLFVDHMNGNRSDNRIGNLRVVSHRENVENQQHPSRNKSGLPTGARKAKKSKRFFASVTVDKKVVYLGTFATAAEASEAYFRAKRELHTGYLGQASSISLASEAIP